MPATLAPRRSRQGLDRRALELRDDLVPVGADYVLLPVGHEVDVVVVDADRLELLELRGDLLDVADHGEAVADLVGDELPVRGALAAVVLVVVELPRLDIF